MRAGIALNRAPDCAGMAAFSRLLLATQDARRGAV
jgi:hypothetical protein